MANVLASVAAYETEVRSERQLADIAVAKATLAPSTVPALPDSPIPPPARSPALPTPDAPTLVSCAKCTRSIHSPTQSLIRPYVNQDSTPPARPEDLCHGDV